MLLQPRMVASAFLCLSAAPLIAADWPMATKVERQPLAAQIKRVADALEYLGAPLPPKDLAALDALDRVADAAVAVARMQKILDAHCLAGVTIPVGPAGSAAPLQCVAGPANKELAEQGWRVFLVKVLNPGGKDRVTMNADSPNALPLFSRSTSRPDPKVTPFGEITKRFLDLAMFGQQPLVRELSGLELEYRILQIYCRDAGIKEGALAFSLWRDTGKQRPAQERLAVSNAVKITFDSRPAVLVKLHVKDHDGQPVMGSFVFRDSQGRVYPAQTKRLAPDFGFHPQIYRTDGETVALQPGNYIVTYTRGPEYLVEQRTVTVPATATHSESFALRRWIHPAARGWYSGDHHIHAAGCAHYESPTEGVTPEDMMRHVLGEDLNVGCCLSWGPCWYHQKRYFDGKTHGLSTPSHLLRYDVEVSGFPSSHCGHICLLRLREQDFPGTKLIDDWPSWDLPIFRWAKAQGGVVGFAHSGWGLEPENPADPLAQELPNLILPRMDGIGANEYLVDVAHGMCDFISTVDTPSLWELNIWYHSLNCGYRCRISGETDFPCIFGERVGLGRSYVHLNRKLDFDHWVDGIKQGRCYVSDGKSHLMDFAVNGAGVGLQKSEVRLASPGTVPVTANVAAWLEPKPTPQTERIRRAPLTEKPYWDVERSRIGSSRKVSVEVIVNGRAVGRQEIVADGVTRPIRFEVPIKHSSWVCLRVFPSSHTNPVFVLVEDKPIRASQKSADWCLRAIDKCWTNKQPRIRAGREREAALAAYDFARKEYQTILHESIKD